MIIKSVEFVLENCEGIKIDYPDICHLRIGKYKERFSTYCNVISKSKVINKFEFIIHPDAKISNSGMFNTDKCPKERLMLGDITGIQINYENDKSEFFVVRWPKGHESYHPYHKNVNMNNGGLYMYCSYKGKMKPMNSAELEMITDMTLRND